MAGSTPTATATALVQEILSTMSAELQGASVHKPIPS